MTPFRVLALGGLGLMATIASPRAQRATDGGAPAQPSFESATTAVLVDVVVRDRQGRPVTDLRVEDFEVRENEVLQPIGSFTRVVQGTGIGITVGIKGAGAATAESSPSVDATPSEETPMVTALVFDALSSSALGFCKRAALAYLPRSASSASRVGVFTTEPTVRMLQTYTDHPALVRRAVAQIMSAGTSVKEQMAEPLAVLRERRDLLDVQSAAATSATDAQLATSSGNIGQLEMERRLVQGQLRMIGAFESLDRDHRGFATTSALFAVLQTLVEMPGRKTVVFFSEGLPASPALQAHLQSIIEVANRLNVTVYTVDAGGLRALSSTTETRKEVEEAGKVRLRELAMVREGAEEPMMRAIERAEDLLQLDSQAGLARLAEGTGGFLVRDTNNLGRAFQRIDEDMRFHYLLTYVPSNQGFDGTFRTIGVNVRRPGVRVFARKGYRALRMPPAVPVFDYEVPALAALDASRLPTGVPFAATVLSFPEPRRPGLVLLLVRLGTDVLTFEERSTAGTYSAHTAIVVRFKDGSGKIVEKLSQQYQLSGRLHELPAARRGEILFYREPDLAPGVYTMEAAVHDGVAGRVSAKVATVEVPRTSDGQARLSSIVIVRVTEQLREGDEQVGGPLHVGNLLLYPSTGEPVSRTKDRELTFYYTLYPRASASKALRADVELRRNGQTVARVPAELGVTDTTGRIQQVSRLPLASLDPGLYELGIVVHDGGHTMERRTFFSVIE